MTAQIPVTLIPGDGIGPEVVGVHGSLQARVGGWGGAGAPQPKPATPAVGLDT